MSEPNIPVIPSSFPSDQAKVLAAMKAAIELLMGQGRTAQSERAARYKELLSTRNSLTDAIASIPEIDTPSGATPDPPTDLTVLKGMWVHFLTWTNPEDTIVSHIEIWRATNTQSISEAKLVAIVTVTDDLRGEEGNYKASLEDVTADYTYWIRSVSYAGNHSTWEPIEAQGGYVVTGDDSIGETIDAIMAMLRGETPDLYLAETVYSFNNRCRTSDNRVWKYINLSPSSGNEPPNLVYWERSGILLTGDIDGILTVGIDGNLVVDGTILARHLQAATINAGHIDTGEAFIGLTIQSANFDADTKTGWQISNEGSQFYNGIFTIGAGSTGYDNITDIPTSLGDINSDEYNSIIEANNFISVTYPADTEVIEGLIDGKIASWFTTEEDADPSTSWTGTDTSHEGDMWWDGFSNELKRWLGTTWSAALTDRTAMDAYTNAANAQDTADGKRRVFVAEPFGPYDIGDLWSTESVIKRSTANRESGYDEAEWVTVSDITNYTTVEAYALAYANAYGEAWAESAEAAAKIYTEAWSSYGADKTADIVSAMAYKEAVNINDMDSSLTVAGKIRSDVLQTDVLLVGDVGELAALDSLAYSALTGTKPPSDADKTSSNSAAGLITGADISYAKANGYTLISGGYLNTGILKVGSAQIDNLSVTNAKIGNLEVGTTKIADYAVNSSANAYTSSALTLSRSYQVLQVVYVPYVEVGDVLTVIFQCYDSRTFGSSGSTVVLQYNSGSALVTKEYGASDGHINIMFSFTSTSTTCTVSVSGVGKGTADGAMWAYMGERFLYVTANKK